MPKLDVDDIGAELDGVTRSSLELLETFDEIESTNSYLMQREAPPPGQASVALTDNQTKGRGRHGRTWQSPPGSGLCVSVGFTFTSQPANLPALTLTIGLGAIAALERLGVSGVQLKWPNDLVAGDGKLGGILTETRSHMSGSISIVSGLGINVDLGEKSCPGVETDWAYGVADLAGFVDTMPSRHTLATCLVEGLCTTFFDYEANGFEYFAGRWPDRDWLFGRALTIETPQRQVAGVGAGIARDGALLVDTGTGAFSRITSGSVVMAGIRETQG